MVHPFSAIVTASGAITFTDRDGTSHTIVRENGRYDEAKELLTSINNIAAQDGSAESDHADPFIDELVKIATPAKAIEAESDGKIAIREGVVYYRDERGETALHDVVAERIIWLLAEGFDARPMISFLGFLMENPSYRSVNDLYRFLEKNQMGITPDGYLLAYKKVRHNYTDIHSGTFDNHPGQKPSMRRNEVEDNPNITCSKGLHVCSFSYLPEFGSSGGGDRVVVCKVNPRDVVSVPTDYNDAKMRVCEYEVLYEVTNYRHNDTLGSRPVSDEDGTFNEPDNDCPDCGSDHYANGYCSQCGYEADPADSDEHDGLANVDNDNRPDQPWDQQVEEEPPVIEYLRDDKWQVLENHCCNTREEAENYVAALGDGVRIQPKDEPTEWPLAKPVSPPQDAPVDLRKAVDGVSEAATGLYGEGAKVNVDMKLEEGKLQVNITPTPTAAAPDKLTREQVFDRVKRIVVLHLGVDEDKVTDEADFFDDLGADSLDIVELVMAIEEEFTVEIDDHAAERCHRVGDVVNHLLERL